MPPCAALVRCTFLLPLIAANLVWSHGRRTACALCSPPEQILRGRKTAPFCAHEDILCLLHQIVPVDKQEMSIIRKALAFMGNAHQGICSWSGLRKAYRHNSRYLIR